MKSDKIAKNKSTQFAKKVIILQISKKLQMPQYKHNTKIRKYYYPRIIYISTMFKNKFPTPSQATAIPNS